MALITTAEVIARGRFTAGEFEWAERADDSTIDARAAVWVGQASRYINQAVGDATYASVVPNVKGCLADAELSYALYQGLRQRLMMLSSRPEEAPPDVYIDLTALRAEIETLKDEVDELLAPYRTDYTRQPGLAFAFGGTVVDEGTTAAYDHNAEVMETLTTRRDIADYGGLEPGEVSS
jgi:hypothetical protein